MVIFQGIDANKLIASSRSFVGNKDFHTKDYIGHVFNNLSHLIAERTEWPSLTAEVHDGEDGTLMFWAFEKKASREVSLSFVPRATGKAVVQVKAREHEPRVFSQFPERNGYFSDKQLRQVVAMINDMAGKSCAL